MMCALQTHVSKSEAYEIPMKKNIKKIMNEPQEYNPLNMVAEVGKSNKEPTPRRDIDESAIFMIGSNHRGENMDAEETDRKAWTPAKSTPMPMNTPEGERRGRKTGAKTKDAGGGRDASKRSRSSHRSPEGGPPPRRETVSMPTVKGNETTAAMDTLKVLERQFHLDQDWSKASMMPYASSLTSQRSRMTTSTSSSQTP